MSIISDKLCNYCMTKLALSPGRIMSSISSRVSSIKAAPGLKSGYLSNKTQNQFHRMGDKLTDTLGDSWDGKFWDVPWFDPLKGKANKGLRIQRKTMGRDVLKNVYNNPNVDAYRANIKRVKSNAIVSKNYTAADKVIKADYSRTNVKNTPTSTWPQSSLDMYNG